jgi:hypothetical protein
MELSKLWLCRVISPSPDSTMLVVCNSSTPCFSLRAFYVSSTTLYTLSHTSLCHHLTSTFRGNHIMHTAITLCTFCTPGTCHLSFFPSKSKSYLVHSNTFLHYISHTTNDTRIGPTY